MSSRPCRNASILAAALVALAQALPAQAPDPRFDAVRDTIRAIMAAGNVPSVSVAIARGDSILWEESFGWADRERQIRATPHTLYSLASISKPITATGLMVLVERGRVELDQPANRYLGPARLRAFEGVADSATVRRLLTHTAGLPLHYQFFYEGLAPVHTMDTAIARYGVLIYPPGERYYYSNLGYGILDHIIARVSGASYPAFMQREVFGPLGLTEMTVSDGAGLGAGAAVRYDTDGSPLKPYTFDHLGASSVYASAHDLVRFGQWHLGSRVPGAHDVISREMRERMQRTDMYAAAAGVSRGLGWGIVEDDNGLRRVAHSGGMPGVATVLMLYPAESLAVVVLSNTSGTFTGRIAGAMTSALSPAFARTRQARADSARAARAAAREEQRDSAAGQPGYLGDWRGHILVRGDSVPLAVQFTGADSAMVRLGQGTAVAGSVRRSADWLSVTFRGEILGPDAAGSGARGPHAITVNLTPRGERLTGWAAVTARDALVYGAVSYRAVLDR